MPLAVGLGHAHEVVEHLRREPLGEVVDEVELRPVTQRVEVLPDRRFDVALERADTLRRERLGDEPAQTGVQRRVVDAEEARHERRAVEPLDVQLVEHDALGAAVGHPVLVGGLDILVARQGPEVVGVVAVDGGVVPQPPVGLPRSVEEVVGQRIEFHTSGPLSRSRLMRRPGSCAVETGAHHQADRERPRSS